MKNWTTESVNITFNAPRGVIKGGPWMHLCTWMRPKKTIIDVKIVVDYVHQNITDSEIWTLSAGVCDVADSLGTFKPKLSEFLFKLYKLKKIK